MINSVYIYTLSKWFEYISGPTRCLNHDSMNEGSTTNSSSGTSMPTVPQTTSVAAKLLFKSSLANPRQHLGILNLKVSLAFSIATYFMQ